MTIIALTQRAAHLPVDPLPALQAVRAVVGQYWRRSMLLTHAGAPLPALAVFDDALVEALFSVKLHLQFEPGLRPALIAAIHDAGAEVRRPEAMCFAQVCMELMALQSGHAPDLPAEFGGTWLAQAPEAVFDALRFCFDDAVGRYLARGVSMTLQRPTSALALLLLRIAIARPAVSDDFSRAVATAAARLPGGLAALACVRTTCFAPEALQAPVPTAVMDDDASLLAAALARSEGLAEVVRGRLARTAAQPASAVAWAFGVACLQLPEVHGLLQTRAQAGDSPESGVKLLYLCALLGHATLLRDAAQALDWQHEAACRAIRDAAGLLTGSFDDVLFDLRIDASERQALLQSRLEAALMGQSGPVALRLGRPRDQVPLEDSAPPVGAPLRQWLYLEHAARTGSAVWLAADDLAQVQALGVMTASMLERWGRSLQGLPAG